MTSTSSTSADGTKSTPNDPDTILAKPNGVKVREYFYKDRLRPKSGMHWSKRRPLLFQALIGVTLVS